MERSRRARTPVPTPAAEVLRLLIERLAVQGYDHVLSRDESTPGVACALVRGAHSPAVLVLAIAPGAPLLAPSAALSGEGPRFGLVSDGEVELAFDLAEPLRPLDRLPATVEAGAICVGLWREGEAPAEPRDSGSAGASPSRHKPPLHPAVNRSEPRTVQPGAAPERNMIQGFRLLRGLRDFQEQAALTVRERLDSPNDILLEAAKLLFLEGVRQRHGERALFPVDGRLVRLDEAFEAARQGRSEAAAWLRAAFDHFKAQPDQMAVDHAGHAQPIFDAATHLLLTQPRNLETLLAALPEPGDSRLVGSVFARFVQAAFDGRSEGGVYLTPPTVREAMLSLAFHDLLEETPGLLTASDADGRPAFRFGDPACGTYGLGVGALEHLERALQYLPEPKGGRRAWMAALGEHGFFGADSSPLMVTLARVTLSLLNAPRAPVFYTPNSLTDGPLRPCSLDLICTNPPFGALRLPPSRRAEMDDLLERFRSDLRPGPRRGGLVYEPTVAGLALGGRPTGDVWKPARPGSVDLCVLFLDRCLQLLKPGGRLLIVLPDGILCNSGDRYVRQYLMGKKEETTGQFRGGKAIVRAVIGLPSETLKSAGTAVKTSILYVQKRHARADDPSRFADEPQGPVFMAAAESLSDPDDLARITVAYRSTSAKGDKEPTDP